MVLAFGASAIPAIAPRLGLPEAVAQIGFGIALGAFGFHPHGSAEQVLHVLAELGFVLLMFGAGAEIDFEAIRRGGKAGLLRGAGTAFSVLALSFGLAAVLGLGLFYGVVLSATSIGLGVVVLRETGQLSTPTGQATLLVGSIGEFLTLVAMTVLAVVAHVGVSWQLAVDLGRLVALVAVGGAFLALLRAWTWWNPLRLGRLFAEHDSSELGVRAAIFVMLSFVLLSAALQIEPVLGAFIGGAVLRAVFRDLAVLEHKMSALSSGFFVPIFFVEVGLVFDLETLSWTGMVTALGLGLLVVLIRVLPTALLLRGVELGPREATGVALLLAAPLTLLVAIARLGEELALLGGDDASALVLLAIGLSVATPVAFRRLVAPES